MSAGATLATRLTARLPEIESAVLTRVEAVANPGVEDPDYLIGLRDSVRIAVRYALRALECGSEKAGPPPDQLLHQVRRAARNGVSLDTILRRCLAGHTLLLDVMLREAAKEPLFGGELEGHLGTQAIIVDRLLAVVSEEHSRASALVRSDGSAARRLRSVERLLDGGDPGLAREFRYDFGGHHIALVAAGPGATELFENLAVRLDRALLAFPLPEQPVVWAWLGGRRPLGVADLFAEVSARRGLAVRLAIGEPGEDIAGWRRSHNQARAAWPIARRGSDPTVRYADVAIIASILRDGLLTDSLRKLYLEPLEDDRDGGETLRRTLRAYFTAERSAASAAASLGVSRQAVSRRLRNIETRIGRPLGSCVTELETALEIRQIDGVTRRA